jgi:pantothenate synthetase
MWKDLIAYLADLAVFDELDEVLVVDPRVGEEVCYPQQPGLFSGHQTIMSKLLLTTDSTVSGFRATQCPQLLTLTVLSVGRN